LPRMTIYKISDSKFLPLAQKKFDLEKDIQKITEDNLDSLFGIRFVSGGLNGEFSIGVTEQDFYIDTLAYDESQKSIVIIEYKKDKSISVIDQGFAYLSAVLNHKADLVLELNEKLKKSFTKDDINWEASRVIFVSPEFTNFQRNAINFKDLPIFLYEVNLYEGDLIEYDPIKPYRTTESIAKITKDKTIQDVSKAVKVYSEEDLLSKVQKAKDFYESLKEALFSIDGSLIFHPTKVYVGVQMPGNWRSLASIAFRQNELFIDYTRSQPSDFDDPKNKLVYKLNSLKYFNQHISTLNVKNDDDVKYAVFLFKQAYERFIGTFGK
jgi:hypothetical protein